MLEKPKRREILLTETVVVNGADAGKRSDEFGWFYDAYEMDAWLAEFGYIELREFAEKGQRRITALEEQQKQRDNFLVDVGVRHRIQLEQVRDVAVKMAAIIEDEFGYTPNTDCEVQEMLKVWKEGLGDGEVWSEFVMRGGREADQ